MWGNGSATESERGCQRYWLMGAFARSEVHRPLFNKHFDFFFFFFLCSWECYWITCSVVEFRLWEGLFYLSLVSLITPVARMLFPDCSPAWRPALPSGYGSYSSFCHTGSGGPGTWTSLGLNFCTSAFFSAAVASLHSVQRELILKLLRQKKYVIFPVP